MEVDNKCTKHWWMDTTYPNKEMKIKSSWTKFIIKTFISTCVAGMIPKLGLQDERLWKILSSTNINNSHAHEATKILWAWTPFCLDRHLLLIFNLQKKLHIFSCSFKRWSWSSSCLNYTSLFKFLFELFLFLSCFERLYMRLSRHLFLFSIVFLLLQAWNIFLLSLFAPNLNNFLSQLYNHSLCPCNSNLYKSTLTCILT